MTHASIQPAGHIVCFVNTTNLTNLKIVHLSYLSFDQITFTSSSPCRKDQLAVLYFFTSLIVLIQVYNWENRHHSLVCCCGLADIFYMPKHKAPRQMSNTAI